MEIIYICDNFRHLVCYPYTRENLHKMADDLGINRCWYRRKGQIYDHPHYDIPKGMIEEVMKKSILVSKRVLADFVHRGEVPGAILYRKTPPSELNQRKYETKN